MTRSRHVGPTAHAEGIISSIVYRRCGCWTCTTIPCMSGSACASYPEAVNRSTTPTASAVVSTKDIRRIPRRVTQASYSAETIRIPVSTGMDRTRLSPPVRGWLVGFPLPPCRGERPDDQQVDRDQQNRPERRVEQPREVHHRRDCGDHNARHQ